MTEHTDAEIKQKLWSMIEDIGTGMLTTEDGGKLRSRPMRPAQTEFTTDLWFFTRESSHKVDEVKSEHHVGLTFANPSKEDYVSLSGRATIVKDRALITAHWSEPMRAWFPKGIDDPDVALLKVAIDAAEYWDAPNSTMIHAYGYLKARLTGEAAEPGGNEKVSFT